MGVEISRSHDHSPLFETPEIKHIEPERDVMIVGASKVGKTTLFNRLVDEPISAYKGTIGIEPKTITINNKQVKIWDTLPINYEPGPIHQYLMEKCSVFILVFSVIDRSSWLKVGHACRMITEKAENPVMILVGTFDSNNGVISNLEIETLRMQYQEIVSYIIIHDLDDYYDILFQLEQIIT